MTTGPQQDPKKWQPGDLVLLESGPKVHGQLMEVVEVRQNRARTVYLDNRLRTKNLQVKSKGRNQEDWHPLEELRDPALFLKTEEFVQTLQERARCKSKS